MTAVRDVAHKSLKRELSAIPAHELEAFWVLMNTPSFVSSNVMKRFTDSEESFFDFIYPITVTTLKGNFVLDVLGRLCTACATNDRGLKEVAIDNTQMVLPSLHSVFKNNPDILMNIVEESYLQGGISTFK